MTWQQIVAAYTPPVMIAVFMTALLSNFSRHMAKHLESLRTEMNDRFRRLEDRLERLEDRRTWHDEIWNERR